MLLNEFSQKIYLKGLRSNLCLNNFKSFAGFPATTSFFFTFLVTTAPAPINAPSSIVNSGNTVAFKPIVTKSLIIVLPPITAHGIK